MVVGDLDEGPRRVVPYEQHFGLHAGAAERVRGGVEHGLDVLFHAALVVAQLLGRGAGGIQLAAQAGWWFVTVDDDDLAVAKIVGERDRLVERRRGARRAVVPEHDRVRHPPPSSVPSWFPVGAAGSPLPPAGGSAGEKREEAVSYTHLTLPT